MCELMLTIGCVIIIFLVLATIRLERMVSELVRAVERFEGRK